MISRTRHHSRHALAAVLVAGLAVASCGSDSESSDSPDQSASVTEPIDSEAPATDPSATETPATEPPATEPAGTEPTSTEVAATDPSDPVSSDVPTSSGLDDSSVPEDSAGVGGFGGEIFPPESIDDIPVCQAYASFFSSFVTVAFAGAFAEFGDPVGEAVDDGSVPEGSEPDDETADDEAIAELLEVVLYLDVADDAQLLRDELPESLSSAIEPMLERAIAVPGIMQDAGFSDDEIDQIIQVTKTGGELESIEDDDPRLTDAAEAMVAEFGPFADALEALDSTNGATDAEGTAYLESTCPKLAAVAAEAEI